ncbi:MAG: hypothetical protein PHQ80_01815 [Candidatus ainarchaeum sp.]|nr:hypothetical protein [Candidatus ainarchaeum sp.]MDD5096283.1 hypothetical protein [Candidatus ainarchaeum sp.]
MKAFLAVFALFAVLHAATLQGNVYSADSFDAVQGALVKAEGASTYQVLSSDGTYSMQVVPGAYNISAYYYENGTLKGYAEDGIAVGAEGASYDIVLFSPDEFEGIEGFETAELDENIPEVRNEGWTPALAGGLVLLVVIVAGAAYFLFVKKKAEKAPAMERKRELDGEEKKVLEILKGSEGMRNQKELREILKCTDTKISLLISSLEAQGYVKRIKKGRENIVKLVKG